MAFTRVDEAEVEERDQQHLPIELHVAEEPAPVDCFVALEDHVGDVGHVVAVMVLHENLRPDELGRRHEPHLCAEQLGFGRIEIFTKPGTDHYRGQVQYNYANDFWNSRNPYSTQKAPLLLQEFEGNASGPIGKRASFTVDAQRNTVDNGAIINAVTVDPQTLGIQPFFSIFRIPQRFTRVSPRLDYQLNENNTLTFRYSATHSDINGSGIGGFDLIPRGYEFQYLNQTVQLTETAVLGTSINETR